jgi:hypothetical protein
LAGYEYHRRDDLVIGIPPAVAQDWRDRTVEECCVAMAYFLHQAAYLFHVAVAHYAAIVPDASPPGGYLHEVTSDGVSLLGARGCVVGVAPGYAERWRKQPFDQTIQMTYGPLHVATFLFSRIEDCLGRIHGLEAKLQRSQRRVVEGEVVAMRLRAQIAELEDELKFWKPVGVDVGSSSRPRGRVFVSSSSDEA